MAQTAKEYFEQICKEAGMSAEETTALVAVASNEKLSPKLNETVRRATDDFNAALGRVKAAEDKVKRYDEEWYPKANGEYQRMKAEYDKAMTEVKRYQDTGLPPEFDASKYMTKEDVVQVLQDQAQRVSSAIKSAGRLSSRHASRFAEELDFDAVDKLAGELKVPIDVAYDKFIEPRVKEQEAKKQEEWKKSTRSEIERDLRSQYKLPVDPVPTETAPVFNRIKADDVPKDMTAELMSAWNGVGKG